MATYDTISDVPGLHFEDVDYPETNVKFSGDVNSNPDIAPEVLHEPQTVMVDELGFLWRTKSDHLNRQTTLRIVSLDLADKLRRVNKSLQKQTGLSEKTKVIYLVRHGDKLLSNNGHDIDMTDAQAALWLRGDGLAAVSHAKVALRKMFGIDSKGWVNHINEKADLELVRVVLTDDIKVTTA